MFLPSRTKHLLAATALGVAALTMSLPAEARMGGGHMGHMGGFHHMGGMGGFHHGGFAGRGFGGFHHGGFHHRGFGFGGPFAAGLIGGAALGGLYGYGGYGYPYGGYYSNAGYGGECYVIRRRVYSPWGSAIRKQLVCEQEW
jgi:hypothetical protein